MKKILAIVMGVAFVFSTMGYAVAQTPPAAPKADEKKADDKKTDKAEKKGKKGKKGDKDSADKKSMDDKKAPTTDKK